MTQSGNAANGGISPRIMRIHANEKTHGGGGFTTAEIQALTNAIFKFASIRVIRGLNNLRYGEPSACCIVPIFV